MSAHGSSESLNKNYILTQWKREHLVLYTRRAVYSQLLFHSFLSSRFINQLLDSAFRRSMRDRGSARRFLRSFFFQNIFFSFQIVFESNFQSRKKMSFLRVFFLNILLFFKWFLRVIFDGLVGFCFLENIC